MRKSFLLLLAALLLCAGPVSAFGALGLVGDEPAAERWAALPGPVDNQAHDRAGHGRLEPPKGSVPLIATPAPFEGAAQRGGSAPRAGADGPLPISPSLHLRLCVFLS